MSESDGWRQMFDEERKVVFQVPVDDIVVHELKEDVTDCVCGPIVSRDVPSDRGPVTVVTHCSLDGREMVDVREIHICLSCLARYAAGAYLAWRAFRWLRAPWRRR